MGTAASAGAVPLGPHGRAVVPHGIEDGGEQPALWAGVTPQSVEHEAGDRRVAHHADLAEHLEMPGDCGLRQVEHSLEIGDEERRGRETIQDPEASRLGDRHQEVGGRQKSHAGSSLICV